MAIGGGSLDGEGVVVEVSVAVGRIGAGVELGAGVDEAQAVRNSKRENDVWVSLMLLLSS